MKKSQFSIFIFTSLILSIFTSISIINAKQDINIKLEHSGVIRQGFYEAKNSKGETISTNFDYDFKKIIVKGEHAFCIEPEVIVGSGGGYKTSEFTSKEREVFSRIIYHGYDNTPKSNKDYVVTQHVLWDYIDSIRDDLTINTEWSLKGINYSTEKSRIMNKVYTHEKVANFSENPLSVSEGQILTVEDLNHVLSQSDIIDTGGLNIKQTHNKLEISVLKDSPANSVIKFKKFSNIKENSSVSPILYSHPQQQNVIVGGNPNPIIYEVKVEVEHRASLKIVKLDETTNEPIPNTTFELYDSNMKLIETFKTNSQGFFLFEYLPYGSYHIKEIDVPFPYVLDPQSQVQKIALTNNKYNYNLVFKNQKTSIIVSKNDKETKEPISNTIFNLYDENKALLQTITTGEDGLATVEGLDYGDYYVEEISVPEPYVLNPDNRLQEFTLSKDNNHYEAKFENEKALGKLKLIKIDRKTNKPLEGIKFNLYDITDLVTSDITHEILLSLDAIKSNTTPSDGTLEFTDLDISRKYALIEVESIYGYKLSEEIYKVDFDYIDQDTPIIENTLNVYNEREEVVIRAIKKNFYDKSVITDKHFILELSDQEGNIIEPSSFKDGIYTWNAIALETYNLKETVAPNGYSLSNKVIKIDTSKQTEDNVYTVEFFNSKIPKTGVNNQTYLYIILIGLSVITITIIRKRRLRQ